MKPISVIVRMILAVNVLFLPCWQWGNAAWAKIDCGPTANKSTDLPRTAAIGTNPAGTGAHAIASGLAAVASKATPISVKVQPYNGPNAWMPLLEGGEIEMGIMNILDSYMAATGTGEYKKPVPSVRILSGGVFPFTVGIVVRDKSDIKKVSDLKGKRMAWDFGGHAINQTLQNLIMETDGLKPTDVTQVRVSNLNDGVRGIAEGKTDGSIAALGIGLIEEVNAMEPLRFLSLANTESSNKIAGRIGASIVKATPASGVKGDTNVLGYPLQLVTSTKVNDKSVYALAKAWWDNLTELQTMHPLFKRWTKETQAIVNFTVPYHAGAIQFYKEVGIWSPKNDARTKEVCS